MSTVSYYRSDWTLLMREIFDDDAPTITVHRWLPSDDDIYGSLFGPQALAAHMFSRLNPHWYLDGDDE